MFLQLPTKFDLRPVFPTRAVVGEYKVGVAVVENGEFAQRVRNRLVRFGQLNGIKTLEDNEYCYNSMLVIVQ